MTTPISINSKDVPVPPNTVTTILLGVATAQAVDFAADSDVIRITPLTTAGAAIGLYVNLYSTSAAIPASGTSAASSGVNLPIYQPTMFSVPSSTGMSVIANSACFCHVECWKR